VLRDAYQLFELFQRLLHDINILGWNVSRIVELESVFDLLSELLAKNARLLVGETINAGRNGAFVGEVPGDAPLVFGAGARDEGRVVQQPVLGSVPSRLQGSAEKTRSIQSIALLYRNKGTISRKGIVQFNKAVANAFPH